MSLKQEYDVYIARLKKSGAKLTAYPCPACHGEIEALVPPKGDQYDSLVQCPHCGVAHFKVVNDAGRVTAKPMFVQHARRQGRSAAARKRAGGGA